MLDEVCDRIREMKEQGQTRPDASLGLIESQEVADRLKAVWSVTGITSKVRNGFPRALHDTHV